MKDTTLKFISNRMSHQIYFAKFSTIMLASGKAFNTQTLKNTEFTTLDTSLQ